MKMKKMSLILIIVLALLLGACGRNTNDAANNEEDADTVITQVVLTAWAAGTETAIADPATPTYTPTIAATNTQLPTMQPSPTQGSTTPTATIAVQQPPGGGSASSCDSATFVSDVSIPDGTQFNPGTDFTKTWELTNTGTCTWNASYQIVFFGGEQMAENPTAALTGSEVAPGETIEVSIDMTAPDTNGEYYSYWVLRNANGQNFFIDGSSVYVQIKVGTTPTNTPGPTATPTNTPEPNDAPVVTISAPASGFTGTVNVAVVFNASANDTEDGDISSSIVWSYTSTSSGSGNFPSSGPSVNYTFTDADTYTVTAKVTDSGGKSKTATVEITIDP
ncbi:MAG TPA: NBR1-Ig-like domain-containing protein [Anaerolineales bacterium]|nr:NBR1-Ig-like domain-containing protein [Anaerolineales bacterium]